MIASRWKSIIICCILNCFIFLNLYCYFGDKNNEKTFEFSEGIRRNTREMNYLNELEEKPK